jgi:hypothetical protein
MFTRMERSAIFVASTGRAASDCAPRAKPGTAAPLARRGLLALVGHDLAVGEADRAVCVLGDIRIVRDQEHGPPIGIQLLQKREHFLAGAAVERAGGLVGENDLRLVHQRARDRNALLLSAGEFGRPVLGCGRRVRAARAGARPRCARFSAPGIDRRNFHVFRGRDRRQQIEALKYESEGAAAQRRQFVERKRRYVVSRDAIAAAGRPVEAADDVHERRFAGARRTHDGDEFAGFDRERHAVERAHHRLAVGIEPPHVLRFRAAPVRGRRRRLARDDVRRCVAACSSSESPEADRARALLSGAPASPPPTTTRSPSFRPSFTSASCRLERPIVTRRVSISPPFCTRAI